MKLIQGTIKIWFERKGYGFIKQDDDYQDDLFFHFADLVNKEVIPKPGDRVRFHIIEALKGLRARAVVILDKQTD